MMIDEGKLGPEYRLLVECCRTVADEGHTARIEALLRHPELKWGTLVVMAGYHGIQSLLYYHLREVDEELLSEEHVVWLRGVIGARSAHSLILTGEMGRLAGVLDEHGVPYLLVKGPVLALGSYGGIAMRPFTDLDLIVDKTGFPALEELLSEQGYGSAAMTPFQKRSYLFIHGQYSFWRRLSDVGRAYAFLDVHTGVMPPGYSYSETFGALYERRQTLRIGGADVPCLGAEDTVALLCFHGFKSRWNRLKYVCDLAEMLRAHPDLDWDEVYAHMRAMHSRRVLRINLFLAAHMLGVELPESVRSDVMADRRAVQLGTLLVKRMPAQAYTKVEPYFERVRLNMSGQDSILGRIRYSMYAAARRLAELYMPINEE